MTGDTRSRPRPDDARRITRSKLSGSGDDGGGGAPGMETDSGKRVIKSTKSIHTQQADGTWSTVVVPCQVHNDAIGAAADRATGSAAANAEGSIFARMQDELRQEVLDFAQGEAVRDLGRVRIASKAVYEAMMGSDLDLAQSCGGSTMASRRKTVTAIVIA